MRQLAALLRQVAAAEQTDSRRIAETVGALVYAGPAADRFREAMRWTLGQRGGVQSRVAALADRLARAADEVEAQQVDAQGRRERAEAHARRPVWC